MLRLLECGTPGAAFREVRADDLRGLADRRGPAVWVDASAPTPDELRALGDAFGMHRLVVDDLLTGGQRQKAEEFEGQLLVILHVPHASRHGGVVELAFDEVGVVVGDRWIVSSHAPWKPASEAAALVADGPYARRDAPLGVLAGLLSHLVDHYEEAIDVLSAEVEEQDRAVLDARSTDPVPELRRAGDTRHAVLRLRRACGQLREVVAVLVRHELVEQGPGRGLDLELRDVFDHVVRAHDDLDILYERLASLADMRLAVTAYRQNEITKRLSAWGAIVLVPTVVTGWFGMNFRDLSLIDQRGGELIALGLIAAVCLALYVGLRRAGWL